MKKNRQSTNSGSSMDTSRNDVFLGPVIYQDEVFYWKTDIAQHELIVILRPKRLSQAVSNQNFDLTSSNELFETIIDHLKAAQGVENILFQQKDEMLRIWTVLPEYEDEGKRKAVYQQEKLLMKELVGRKYRFDFYIIEHDEVDEVLSSGAISIFNKLN